MDSTVTRLFDAIIGRDLATVRAFLEQGVDPHTKRDDETALMYAAGVSTTPMVRLLLEYGAGNGVPLPMIEAACGTELGTVALFHELGGDVNGADERDWTPLMEAATWGLRDIARFLVEHGADATARCGGLTAADIAERDGHPEVAEYLREKEGERGVAPVCKP